MSAFEAGESGFITATVAAPAPAISLGVIVAVSCVLLKNVVVCGLSFQFTIAPDTKFVPFTVSEKPGPPASALCGESEVMLGVGSATKNEKLPDTDELPGCAPGLTTVTETVPDLATSLAEMAAES